MMSFSKFRASTDVQILKDISSFSAKSKSAFTRLLVYWLGPGRKKELILPFKPLVAFAEEPT